MFALVTGATSGIGLEIAKILASMKYNLIIVGRRVDRLEKLAKEIKQEYSIEVVSYKCDLSKISECRNLIEFTNEYKDISIVINSAGFGKVGYANYVDEMDDIDMINTNIISLHLLTKHFSKIMDKGNIVNISSIAGIAPVPYMATYGATKAYVFSYGMAVNYEMKKLNKKVYITTACPGPVDTEFDDVAGSKFKWKSISAKKCAFDIIKAMKKNKKCTMVGIKTKLAYIGLRCSPFSMSLPIEFRIQTKKTGNK